MNKNDKEFAKCGEIFIANEHDYTFLCYYCNELFYKFIEFRTHNLSHLDKIAPVLKEIQTDENSSDILDNLICNEDEDNNTHNNESIENNTKDIDKENSDDNSEKEKNDFNSINAASDLIDNIIDNKLESIDKEQQNSTEDLYCLHCKTHFKDEFHDVKKCSQIKEKIIEHKGNFLELLKLGILSCKHCQRYFKNHLSLYNHHLKENHCSQNKTCQICKFYLFMNSKINSSNKNIKLDNIGNNSNDQNKIDELEKQRQKRKLWRNKCTACNKIFPTYSEKQKHMKIHSEYFCNYEGCDEKFKFKSLLNQHEKEHKPTSYQCEMCGNNFKSKGNMLQHQRVTHSDPKTWPHQCDICNRRFSQQYRLVHHKRVHTGEKPFGCDICSKFFRKHSNLQEHKKLHSEEGKYKCRLCGKTFKQAAGYSSHLKRHPAIS